MNKLNENAGTYPLRFAPLNTKNWQQFEKLMGEKGGCGGCWCMSFRLTSKEFEACKYNGNKSLMREIVDSNRPTGLIATVSDEPAGWIAFAPREDYIRIENSRSLKRIDDKPVWAITCFFIKKEYRRKGISSLMLKGAIEYAQKMKIKALEAYPVIPYSAQSPPAFLWTGILSVFLENGFKTVKQFGKSKAMVRLEIPSQ